MARTYKGKQEYKYDKSSKAFLAGAFKHWDVHPQTAMRFLNIDRGMLSRRLTRFHRFISPEGFVMESL